MSSIFNEPHFNDEAAAYAYVEARLWADGRICPHCGVIDRSGALKGKSNRVGLYKCYACRKPFTVKIGTIFEASHIAMRDWLTAVHLVCSSKKGVSSNQIARTLGLTVKSAWFMTHRIREALRNGSLSPMGGNGGTVEVDETYIGRAEGTEVGPGTYHKNAVLSLVERGGSVRSFHVDGARVAEIAPIVRANIAREATLMTDESSLYTKLGREFAMHQTVNHADKEYVRKTNVRQFPAGKPMVVTTNTIEGYFSIFKRGMKGVYQHCSEKHLHRYLAEFDFRYNNRVRLGVNDLERADLALQGVVGKRLTYRIPDQEA